MIRVWGNSKPGVVDRRADPVARLPHRGVSEADDRERRQAAADVDLDRHLPGIDPVDRERGDAREHLVNVRAGASRMGDAVFQFGARQASSPEQNWNAACTTCHASRRSVSDRDQRPPPTARRARRAARRRAPDQARLSDRRAQLPHPLGRARHRRVRRTDAGVLRGQDPKSESDPAAARSTQSGRSSARRFARWPDAG